MKTFLIQAETTNGHLLPAFDFCYSVIDAIKLHNWLHPGEGTYDFILIPWGSCGTFSGLLTEGFLSTDYCPIGSVEFVEAWLKDMGVKSVRPLNVPAELWKFCSRPMMLTASSSGLEGKWMLKDSQTIKNDIDGPIDFSSKKKGSLGRLCFLSKWVDNVQSEWRVFVFHGKIMGIRCYSGDEWVLPNRDYILKVVENFDKSRQYPAYTLDLMVYKDSKTETMITDILELHEFFACGLYGFELGETLLAMLSSAITGIMSRNGALLKENGK